MIEMEAPTSIILLGKQLAHDIGKPFGLAIYTWAIPVESAQLLQDMERPADVCCCRGLGKLAAVNT